MNIEQAQALAMICHYAKEHLKDNKTMSQSVDIAQDIIKKELNALEIIINKRVDAALFLRVARFNNVETYNCEIVALDRHLTQKEYDLLKEALL